ncbi:MAG: D-alanyl-D-alanine carboxypeptidase [Defluviitaleaceae bacterium]|nr:D-alanyl-D-alanine carboxypeptidase [Defluviitaleaceae bacterium]MCL2837382.1 D-alanyl-D-alanine carboxypeptidase [Defluviitaleaceae bacterium]
MKKLFFVILIAVISSSVFGAASVYANEKPGLQLNVNAKSAVLLEPSTGKILLEQNADERLAPASVTKVMTMYIIYEALEQGRISLEDIVTVSEHASKMGGSQIFLEPAERQTVRDLLKSVVIASANDASVALAEFISGSEESFVDLMNRTAADMGLKDTQFRNSCGLDADGHYMSARDIAVLTMELINKYPQVFEYSTIWMDSIVHKTARGESEFGLTNTNKLIKWYNGATGLKTGSTGKALYCLSGTAARDNMSLVAVVLASPTPQIRFQEVMKLFDYGFANYKLVTGDEAGQLMGTVAVSKGGAESVPIKTGNRVSAVVPKGAGGQVEAKPAIFDCVEAPVAAGQKLGEIVYFFDGTEIGTSDVIAANDISRASFGDMVRRMPKLWFE